jgi:cobalt-precorrin 5A hydrolase/precorrin-3B C17-methyltransferase
VTPVFVALTGEGLRTAHRAQAALGGEVHALASARERQPSPPLVGEGAASLAKRRVRGEGRHGNPSSDPAQSAGPPSPTRGEGYGARTIDGLLTFTDTGKHLRLLFSEGRPIVGVCAAGILIRILAPLLADKHDEPAVLALSDDGTSVVPLLGGHRGANDLAHALAEALGGHAAITTAGDNRFGVALDAPPEGWTLANPEDAKSVMAALLGGASARLEGRAKWLGQSRIVFSDNGAVRLVATTKAMAGDARSLVYHPRRLAVGLGCERGADPDEAIALICRTLGDAGLAPKAVALVASLDLKADEPAVLAAAGQLGVPARFFSAVALEVETPRLQNPSDAVFREVGCHGVAEGAALAAAGPDATLVVAKRKSARVTCAIAEAPDVIDAAKTGRARGRLAIVGIGPGAPDWLTPEARRLLETSDAAVGYSLYLDLVAPLIADAERFDSALGSEEVRVRQALALAAGGRSVALVSSGDAGIYAMSSLAFECLDDHDLPDAARRVEIVVAPGISAMQAAAARAGAPLGHDFCAISLSDLLTPWEAIEARIQAAAEADFVVAFYNPVSRRRRTQLARAKAILLRRRPPDTPVVIARNLGRDGDSVATVSLHALNVDDVDMLTIVIVGASTTRQVGVAGQNWTYTPRGYEKKRQPSPPLRGRDGEGGKVEGAEFPSPLPNLSPARGEGMTLVHFIGAGPGAPDLITVRGLRLIERSPVCLYAGSLVPAEVVAAAPEGARVVDTAPLTLDEIVEEMRAAVEAGKEVARVHSGDPSLYGAIAEQMRRLDALGIAYDVTPGVPAFAAAAAALGRELTIPEVSQTVILTRTAMKSSAMPDGEELATLAKSRATLVIHLSIRNLLEVERQLAPQYGTDCPVIVAYRVGWPDEAFIHGTLSDIRGKVRAAKITRTALIFVGRALGDAVFRDSALYDAGHTHVLRPKRRTV